MNNNVEFNKKLRNQRMLDNIVWEARVSAYFQNLNMLARWESANDTLDTDSSSFSFDPAYLLPEEATAEVSPMTFSPDSLTQSFIHALRQAILKFNTAVDAAVKDPANRLTAEQGRQIKSDFEQSMSDIPSVIGRCESIRKARKVTPEAQASWERDLTTFYDYEPTPQPVAKASGAAELFPEIHLSLADSFRDCLLVHSENREHAMSLAKAMRIGEVINSIAQDAYQPFFEAVAKNPALFDQVAALSSAAGHPNSLFPVPTPADSKLGKADSRTNDEYFSFQIKQ